MKVSALAVLALLCLQGCAAKQKAVLSDRELDFNKQAPATNLIVLVRSMGDEPSQDQAIINLADISGRERNYSQVLCSNADGNVEVLLSPVLANVDDHIEYFPGGYSLDFYLGKVDAKKGPTSQEPLRVGINFIDVHRPREVFHMDTSAYGRWYLTSAIATKKSDKGYRLADLMNCTTHQRTRDN